MAPSRSGLLPKGTPGFVPKAVKSPSGMVYMRPQWKTVQPYHPGLHTKGTSGFGTTVGLVVKPKAIMVQARTGQKAVKSAVTGPGLRPNRTPSCGATLEIQPKSIIVQTRTRPKTVKSAKTGPGLCHNRTTHGYGQTETIKTKSILVQTRTGTRPKAVKPAVTGSRLRLNKMPGCGITGLAVKRKSKIVQTYILQKGSKPNLTGPGLRPNWLTSRPGCGKARAAKPKYNMVQTRTQQKPVKPTPSGPGLHTSGPSRCVKTKPIKRRSDFTQSYTPLPLVIPSFLETAQELWYLRAQKPIRHGKKQKPVPRKRMRFFLRDPQVNSNVINVFYCSPRAWQLLSWNFEFISKKIQRKEDIYAQGDPRVFVWMVLWSTNYEKLNSTNVHILLRAAVFFKGKILIQNCLAFLREHNLDLAKLKGRFLERLEPYLTNMDLERLAYLQNYKGNTIRYLYFKLTFALMRKADPHRGHFVNMALLYKCGLCKKLVPKELENCIPCISLSERKLQSKRGLRQCKYSVHRADRTWSVESYAIQLLYQIKDWRDVYWLLWSETHYLDCVNCKLTFPVQEMFTCPLNAQHEPCVNNLVEHAIYTTFRKNFQLIVHLYQLKQAKPKEDHTNGNTSQASPILGMPKKLGITIPYGRNSAYLGHRYMGKGHSWQYNKPIITIKKVYMLSYEKNMHGRSLCEARKWIGMSKFYTPLETNYIHDWHLKITTNQIRPIKNILPKLTFSAPPLNLVTLPTYVDNAYNPKKAVSRALPGLPNMSAAMLPDTSTPTRPSMRALTHPNTHTAALSNLSDAASCKAGLLENSLLYEAREQDTIPILCPSAQPPKENAKNCPKFFSDKIPTASLAMRTCTQRRESNITELNPTPSSEALPCPQRVKTKVSKDRNLGAGEHRSRAPATQLPNTRATNRRNLGAGENLTASSEAQPCNLSPRTRLTDHPTLGTCGLASKSLSAQCLKTRVTCPNLSTRENPAASSAVHPYIESLQTRSTTHLNFGSSRKLSEQLITIVTKRPVSTEYARRTLSDHPKTRLTMYPSLGSGESASNTLSLKPITVEMENPTSRAGVLLTAVLPAHHCISGNISADIELGRAPMECLIICPIEHQIHKIFRSEHKTMPCVISRPNYILSSDELPSHTSSQNAITMVTEYPNPGFDEHSGKTVLKQPQKMIAKRFYLLLRKHITLCRSGQYKTKTQCVLYTGRKGPGLPRDSWITPTHLLTIMIPENPNQGSGDRSSKPLSQHSTTMGMEIPCPGAGELTTIPSAHPCTSSNLCGVCPEDEPPQDV